MNEIPLPSTALFKLSSDSKLIKANPLERPSSFFKRFTRATSPNCSSRKFPKSFSSASNEIPFIITSFEKPALFYYY
jgi:hypothetical protein